MDLRVGVLSVLFVAFLLLAPGVDALGTVTRHQRGRKGGQRPSPEVARKLSPRLNVSDVLFKQGSDAAQQSMKVTEVGDNISYSGFFTTSHGDGWENNMFAWYFPSQDGNKDAPLLIWLQGGPGGSSLFGLFAELGPYQINDQGELENMPFTWNEHFSLLFLDNPVGAGYSYTTGDGGYCRDSKNCVAQNLYNLMQQFYQVFPDQLNVELHITGESYAGHYVPAFGAYIHQMNQAVPKGNVKIPLTGIAIGDGWVDPEYMLQGYSDLFWDFSLCDSVQKVQIEIYQDQMLNALYSGDMVGSFNIWDEFLNGDVYPYPSYFYNITGSRNYDNVARTGTPAAYTRFNAYIDSPQVREAMHVGDAVFNDGHQCEMHLLADFMVSLKRELALLMDNYQVMVYSGQLDIIVAGPLTERYIPTIPWDGATDFAASARVPWSVDPTDEEVAGFVQSARLFTRAVVRSAGHILPYDQPRVGLDMITRFVNGVPPFAPKKKDLLKRQQEEALLKKKHLVRPLKQKTIHTA